MLENGSPEDKEMLNAFIDAETDERMGKGSSVKDKIFATKDIEELLGKPKPLSVTKWGAKSDK